MCCLCSYFILSSFFCCWLPLFVYLPSRFRTEQQTKNVRRNAREKKGKYFKSHDMTFCIHVRTHISGLTSSHGIHENCCLYAMCVCVCALVCFICTNTMSMRFNYFERQNVSSWPCATLSRSVSLCGSRYAKRHSVLHSHKPSHSSLNTHAAHTRNTRWMFTLQITAILSPRCDNWLTDFNTACVPLTQCLILYVSNARTAAAIVYVLIVMFADSNSHRQINEKLKRKTKRKKSKQTRARPPASIRLRFRRHTCRRI